VCISFQVHLDAKRRSKTTEGERGNIEWPETGGHLMKEKSTQERELRIAGSGEVRRDTTNGALKKNILKHQMMAKVS